jgi:hypothetical protein
MGEAHLGLLTPQTDCLTCHTPHAAAGRGLIWPDHHEAFASGRCEECHGETGK